jgi:hypothetical protein
MKQGYLSPTIWIEFSGFLMQLLNMHNYSQFDISFLGKGASIIKARRVSGS